MWQRRGSGSATTVIGDRLLALRLEQSMTQAQFARSLKISARTYYDYERGTRSISAEVLVSIYEVYGVSPNWILLGEGLPTPGQAGQELANFLAQLGAELTALEEQVSTDRAAEIIDRWRDELVTRLTRSVHNSGTT